jgi:hypothetical protein
MSLLQCIYNMNCTGTTESPFFDEQYTLKLFHATRCSCTAFYPLSVHLLLSNQRELNRRSEVVALQSHIVLRRTTTDIERIEMHEE